MHCLSGHAQKSAKDQFSTKSAKDQFTKFCRLTPREFNDGAKINFNLLF